MWEQGPNRVMTNDTGKEEKDAETKRVKQCDDKETKAKEKGTRIQMGERGHNKENKTLR